MPAKGYFLYHLDKTTCGGRILAGAADDTYNGRQRVRERDPVSCGKHPGRFYVCGHMGDTYNVNGVLLRWAGSIESFSNCPCKATFIPSMLTDSYDYNCNDGFASTRQQEARKKKLIEARKKGLEPMSLPTLIYQTKNQMDDYQAKDMHYGDLDILLLRNQFHLDVETISTKVNAYTLRLLNTPMAYVIASPYAMPEPPKNMSVISRNEAAALMFSEFKELAKLFSFQGAYKKIITEMIDHMHENSGTPYSNPLLDQAMKEQILNDHSEKSSLLNIKKALKIAINYDYGFVPLINKRKLKEALEVAVLPKFNSKKDYINGLVITVHDTWSTHITLESLEVDGDSYRAKVNYRVQDHFGLDDADVMNPIYSKFRIFRLWFVLQRWDQYGFKPFITEMNATVEINGRRGE